MNNSFNYPNGIKKTALENKTIKRANVKKARLGTDFESLINDSNEYYLNKGIAAIYKKPTPVQIVKVDYPARNRARITEAYYKTPSTTDYNGIYKKQYLDFEAKSCHSTSFPFAHIFTHQIHHLETVNKLGGIAFLLIEFCLYKEIFLLPVNNLLELYNDSLQGGRKSIPYSYFKEHGILINYTYNPVIDYLKAVDVYLEKRTHH